MPPSTPSDDTMSHAKLVQACRFGWAAGPDTTNIPAPAPVVHAPLTTSHIDTRAKRLTPCRGRLYHQLTCSHRIRTDLPEDCGPNCLEPYSVIVPVPFYCHECVEKESASTWKAREANHNANHPEISRMTPTEYSTWYSEHSRLQTEHARDRKAYEIQLRASTRPSNISSALEMSKEEAEFASELDSLSISLMNSREGTSNYVQTQQHRHRFNLPNDASEQLHWGLNSLALDRGSCGIEYSGGQSVQRIRTMREDEP